MKVAIKAALLAALAQGAVTNPGVAAKRETKGRGAGEKSFTLHQVQNNDFAGRDAAMDFIRAHMKYARNLPDTVSKAIESNPDLRSKFSALVQGQKGTVVAQPARGADSEYAVMVDIGLPPQSIPLNLDTGSSDLWTFSTDTDRNILRDQILYRPRDSFTSKLLEGENWLIKYGDGAGAYGIVYKDKVQIGSTHVDDQAIQVAVMASDSITSDNFISGILGMANSAANTVYPTGQNTYIDNIKDQLALPVFTANLRAHAPGNYNFGFIDQSEYLGTIEYASINPVNPLWEITASGYWIGNQAYNETFNAIVDTGTSLTLLPQIAVDNLYSSIKGAMLHPRLGMMVFPCNAEVPDFWIKIGSYNGRLPSRYINYGPVNSYYCFGGIQTSAGIPFSVLGDVFLKAQFVVFNYGDAVVGFANKDLGI